MTVKFKITSESNKYLFYSIVILVVLMTSSIFDVINLISEWFLVPLLIDIFKSIYIGLGIFFLNKYFIKKGVCFFDNVRDLSILKVLVLYVLTIVPIVIVSWLCNWELKILADLGESFDNFALYSHLIGLCYSIAKCIGMVYVIFGFQTFFESTVTFGKGNVDKYIPFGGIALFMTFGIFELIYGVNELSIIYLVFNFYFGVIFLLTEKSKYKTSFLVSIIYLL